jgi:hypothetical protein
MLDIHEEMCELLREQEYNRELSVWGSSLTMRVGVHQVGH